MDFITDFLFASPFQLAAVCTLICLILLVMWRRTGSPGRRKAFLGAVIASVALLLSQEIVVTDRERIIQLMRELAAAVEKADAERIIASIDATYADGQDTRDTLAAAIRARLTVNPVQNPGLSAFEVRTTGDEASAAFRVICDIRDGDTVVTNYPSRWQVDLIRRGDKWMVRNIICLQKGLTKTDRRGGGRGW